MLSLKSSVQKLPELKKLLKETDSTLLQDIYKNLDELKDIYELIENAIIEEPGITITERKYYKTRI